MATSITECALIDFSIPISPCSYLLFVIPISFILFYPIPYLEKKLEIDYFSLYYIIIIFAIIFGVFKFFGIKNLFINILGLADTTWYVKERHDFIIKTSKQLEGLAKLVNNGNDFTNKTIKLGANIIFNDNKIWQEWKEYGDIEPMNKWKPIGGLYNDIYRRFNGTFDGCGFTISRIYINSFEYGYYGLFGILSWRGKIKNLGVIDSYIKGKGDVDGIIGNNEGGKVENCYFEGNVINIGEQ